MPKKKVKVEVAETNLTFIEHSNRIEDNAVDIKELHDKTDKLLIKFEKLSRSVDKIRVRLGI